MGFFDKLLKKANEEKTEEELRTTPASSQYQQLIYSRFYRDYPIKPFISSDREKNTNWLERAEMFPKQSIIPVEIMTRYSDGLLPGHIYLLYWIGKNTQDKKVPAYFEYKYGINVDSEKRYLLRIGLLSADGITDKGKKVIAAHNDVIEKHSVEATSRENAKEKFSDTDIISVEQDTIQSSFDVSKVHNVDGRDLVLMNANNQAVVRDSFAIINKLLVSVSKELKIREKIQIPTDRIAFNKSFSGKLYTYLEYTPLTPTGKAAKYPITVYFAAKDHYQVLPAFDCFGTIGYLADNSIGKVVLNVWFERLGYHIEMGHNEGKLGIKKVERMKDGNKTVIYYKK